MSPQLAKTTKNIRHRNTPDSFAFEITAAQETTSLMRSMRAKKGEPKKKTKVIGGHAMAIRDFKKEQIDGKMSKLNNKSKFMGKFTFDSIRGK